ncbi:MAG: RimK family alpha-L-glutamate ligase [Clostridia bacterium]|nr:RimK family alpha-L-glutamate ligase [Clostridia bacterium]
MKAYLITNHYLVSEKFNTLNTLLIESAQKCGIELEPKTNAEMLSYLTVGGSEEIKGVDFILFWDKDITLCRMLEGLGIKVFNSSQAIAACDNKGLTHAILNRTGIKMPKTIIAPLSFNQEDMTDVVKSAAEKLGFPLIIKESYGSFGYQVFRAHDLYDAVEIANAISPSPMIFQEYISESYGRDVRLNVVGDKVVAAMERYNENDFRANVTNGGKMKPYSPTKEECDIALKACRALGLDFAGVDLLFGKDGPLLCEVNSNAHVKNILDCTGINVAEEIFEYIKGKL